MTVNDTRVRDMLARLAYLADTRGLDHADLILRDFIVIPKPDLPLPVAHPTHPHLAYVRSLTASRGRTAQSPDVLMERALDYIAAAQWAASEPPMDEAKVQRLAKAVQAADEDERLDSDDLDRLARRLVRAGVRPPKDA